MRRRYALWWVLLNVASDYPAGSIEAWAWDTRPDASILAAPSPSHPLQPR
jgi:hypothetical protein